eukprot:s785_g5.t1
MRGDVTASDASEWGGGFCVSAGLSPMGVHAASCQVRGDVPEPEDHIQVLTVGLFDGIGALRVSADTLKLPMGGHISSEVSPEGTRVIESQFPDCESVGPVENITEELVAGWAAKYSNVGVVVVGGGPPCQGVSGLNADRKGALKDARSSLFVHVKRVHGLCVRAFRWAQVHYLMESVFSMDEKDRKTMSEHMDSCPYMIDAGSISICRRPRLYWLSWELCPGPGVVIHSPTATGWEAYTVVELTCQVVAEDYLSKGWKLSQEGPLPTFTTARPRSSPGNRPAGLWQCQPWEVERWIADEHRYPPYVYRDVHCLVNEAGDRRLPNISEKEVAMGFPLGYTASCRPKGKQVGAEYQDARHSLIGNSWHVTVVSWLLQQLFRPLGMTQVQSLREVVLATSPGQDSQLQGYLTRLPLCSPQKQVAQVGEEVLAKKLANFISVKGEDLMIQAPTENVAARAEVMGKKKAHLEGRTREERVEKRKQLGSLRDLAIQPSTRKRYDLALDKFFKFLRFEGITLPRRKDLLDQIAVEYLEHLWSSGEGRALASDTIAAIQHQEPHVKGSLVESWRLLKVWSSNELPNRAPPFPEVVVQAIAGRALIKNDPDFALSILVGFYGMMRTGEVLDLLPRQVQVSSSRGPAILSLGLTKSGKRQGAEESITITVFDVVRRLADWKLRSTRPMAVSARVPMAGKSPSWATLPVPVSNETLTNWLPISWLEENGRCVIFFHLGSFDLLSLELSGCTRRDLLFICEEKLSELQPQASKVSVVVDLHHVKLEQLNSHWWKILAPRLLQLVDKRFPGFLEELLFVRANRLSSLAAERLLNLSRPHLRDLIVLGGDEIAAQTFLESRGLGFVADCFFRRSQLGTLLGSFTSSSSTALLPFQLHGVRAAQE